MEDETEANLVSADEVTAEEAKAALEAEAGAEDQADEAEEQEEEEEDDELDKLLGTDEGNPDAVEIELNGKKYQVHPDLKDGYLMRADYTKKTMALADDRKALEATKAQFDEIANLSQESRANLVEAAALRLQLDALLNTPLDGLTREQVNGLRLDVGDLESRIAGLESKGKQAAEKERAARSQQMAKAREGIVAETAKHIPNFTDQRRTELESFAVTLGASPEFVQQITDPLVYKTLHLADIGHKYVERQKKAKTLADAQQAKPAEIVKGKANSGKRPSDMSPAEMAKHLGY